MRVRNALWWPPFVMYYRTQPLRGVLDDLSVRGSRPAELVPLEALGRRADGAPRRRLSRGAPPRLTAGAARAVRVGRVSLCRPPADGGAVSRTPCPVWTSRASMIFCRAVLLRLPDDLLLGGGSGRRPGSSAFRWGSRSWRPSTTGVRCHTGSRPVGRTHHGCITMSCEGRAVRAQPCAGRHPSMPDPAALTRRPALAHVTPTRTAAPSPPHLMASERQVRPMLLAHPAVLSELVARYESLCAAAQERSSPRPEAAPGRRDVHAVRDHGHASPEQALAAARARLAATAAEEVGGPGPG